MLPKFMQNAPAAVAAEMPAVSRRSFLIGAAATTVGLAVGYRFAHASTEAAEAPMSPFDAYIEVSEAGVITIRSAHMDMGQGAYHGTATLVIEEMDASWDQIEVVGGSGNIKAYGNLAWGGVAQGTGGPTAMVSSWDRYRQAGATARAMLVGAAAKAWGVPAGEITIEDGVMRHAASGKESGFGAFAKAAGEMAIPTDVAVKDRADWKVIGDPAVRRYDSAAKTNGTQDFTIDVTLPGMLTAVMIHPPKFGGKVASFDAAEAKGMKSVVDVVAIHRGVAVVAQDMWSALQARDTVTVEWDFSAAETRGSEEIMTSYKAMSTQTPTAMAVSNGDVEGALASAEKTLEATYEFPFLAHAAMEPLNAVARKNDDGIVEVWGGHQLPDLYQYVASQIAGVTPDKVVLHTMKTGGGFGRRATPDADVVSEAVAIAAALNWSAPVKVQWTRENDMRGGRYRPAYVHRLRAGIDANGKLTAWDDHIVGQSIVKGTPFEAMLVHNGVDHTSVEGSNNLPYAVENFSVGLTTTDVAVPVLWWRAVGNTQNAYAVEVFMDEVAEAAGADPVAFRLDVLKDKPQHAAVLKLAAEKAGWGNALPEGHFHGVAVHASFASFVAQVAEVSMVDGAVKVHKITCAVDCGTAINPDTIKAQIEGGIGFGLGSVQTEEITLVDGEVEQGNYDMYEPLRIDGMPEVDVHIVASEQSPTGIGEPGVPPIGPAVANAIYKATGTRLRALPFAKGGLV